jgi:hypothetical protein
VTDFQVRPPTSIQQLDQDHTLQGPTGMQVGRRGDWVFTWTLTLLPGVTRTWSVLVPADYLGCFLDVQEASFARAVVDQPSTPPPEESHD